MADYKPDAKCRHAPAPALDTLTLMELHMLRTLPPRSAGGGPGHARLLAGLHDRPPLLRLQVQPHAPSPKSGVAAFAYGALRDRTAFSGDLEVAKSLQGMGHTLLCACGPARLAPTAVP